MTRPLRIATWNICWFTRLFDERGSLAADDELSGMYDVPRKRQAIAIAEVLRRVDADIFAIIEAPDLKPKPTASKTEPAETKAVQPTKSD